jgi:hypothetical protein
MSDNSDIDYEKLKFELALKGLKIRKLEYNQFWSATIQEMDEGDSERTCNDGYYIYHKSRKTSYEDAEKEVLRQWYENNKN